MSIQGHLTQLERRHEALDREIAKETIYPAINELKLAELKRRKLLLKDEIMKCAADIRLPPCTDYRTGMWADKPF